MTPEPETQELRWHHRLSTRLTLLLLGVVFVLAIATGILLWRALAAVGIDPAALEGVMEGAGGDTGAALQPLVEADRATVAALLRSTLISLAAVVAVTLIAATAFSRSLLIEPIARLAQASRALAAGDLSARVNSTDPSELGALARSFDAMADSIAGHQDRLEAQVAARTSELRSLLKLSNTIAITSELIPQLEAVLDQLVRSERTRWAEVLELDPRGRLVTLVRRGEPPLAAKQPAGDDAAVAGYAEAPPDRAALVPEGAPALSESGAPHAVVEGDTLAIPLRVRDRVVGVLQAVAPEKAGWDEEGLRWVGGLAAQAAVALENARLYELARDEAADEERRHLARELHDSVSQAIYSVVLTAHAAQKHLPEEAERSEKALDSVIELAEAALAEMRALIFELRPEALAEVGLMGALHRQLDGLELRHGLTTDRELGPEPELAFAAKQVLLRVAQEAFHNVTKHARATRVRVVADTRKAPPAGGEGPPGVGAGAEVGGEHLELCISDDGVGFDPTIAYPGHLGLTSMHERVTALEGRLTIDSAPGEGTTVRVRVPIKAGAGEASA